MSNRLTIQPTFFQNQDSDFNSVGDSHYGFRIHDDYNMAYSTIAETHDGMMSILDEFKGERHIQWIKLVMRYNSEVSDSMIDYVRETERGMYIDQEWFDWDEIKEAFED
mgnify:CR=1 FL=1|jgi:hypothetical protein